MTHTVLLFASYADAFGSPTLAVALPPNATVSDLLREITARPEASLLPRAPRVAVNQEFARADRRIRPDDELAIIPPVAGG